MYQDSIMFTPVIELATVIGLGFLLGLMHYLKEHNIGDRNIINQVEWFAIILIPVASVPEFLKYLNWPFYSFFGFFVSAMGIWVAITLHNRPKGRGFTRYDWTMLELILPFLVLGMLVFWELQAFEAIKHQVEMLNSTKISG